MSRDKIDDQWKELATPSQRCWARRKASGKCMVAACSSMPDGAKSMCRVHLDAQRDRVLAKYHANKKTL